GQGQQLGTMYGANNMDLYNQTIGARNAQLQGAGQLQNLLSNQMTLYGQIPSTLAQYGNQRGNYAQAGMQVAGPYQQDRFGQFQASQYPTKGMETGILMGKSGDRWINAANAMGGAGGGGGGGSSFNQFGGPAGTGA